MISDESLAHIGALAHLLTRQTMMQDQPENLHECFIAFGVALKSLLVLNSDDPNSEPDGESMTNMLKAVIFGAKQPVNVSIVDDETQTKMVLQRVTPKEKAH